MVSITNSLRVGKSHLDMTQGSRHSILPRPEFFILQVISVGAHLNSHITSYQYGAHMNSLSCQYSAYLKAMHHKLTRWTPTWTTHPNKLITLELMMNKYSSWLLLRIDFLFYSTCGPRYICIKKTTNYERQHNKSI